jgi:hypothetical protein
MDRRILWLALIPIMAAGLFFFFNREAEVCEHPITCTTNEQCGGDIITERFCRDGNVYGNGQFNTCANAGECTAVCQTSYAAALLEECGSGCENGACL